MSENMSNSALKTKTENNKYNYDDPVFQEIKTMFLGLVEQDTDEYIFDLKFVCTWLEVPEWYEDFVNNEAFREVFYNENLNGLTTDKGDYKYQIIDGISTPIFSIKGFKKFCMTQQTEKSNLVRRYFIHISSSYHKILQQTN
jgi:phage anti-repressor protein